VPKYFFEITERLSPGFTTWIIPAGTAGMPAGGKGSGFLPNRTQNYSVSSIALKFSIVGFCRKIPSHHVFNFQGFIAGPQEGGLGNLVQQGLQIFCRMVFAEPLFALFDHFAPAFLGALNNTGSELLFDI
jgi:hypothetical protein